MWKLTEFGSGGTDLSVIYSRRENNGTTPISPLSIQTAGGSYDPFSANTRGQPASNFEFNGQLYGDDLDATIRSLTSDIGKRDQLFRAWDDGTTEWIYARLLDVNIERAWPQKFVHPITMIYEIQPPWNGTSRALNGSVTVTGQSIGFANSGNVRQHNVRFYVNVYAGTSATDLNIRNTALGVDLTYSGTLTLGGVDSLEIDSGTNQVRTYDGGYSDAYDSLSINSGHTLNRFLALDPGNNVFVFSYTGSASLYVTAYFYDAVS